MADLKSWEEFFHAVETMRICQIEYFKAKSTSALIAAKKYEAMVDLCIKEHKQRLVAKKQQELFGGTHA